MSIELPLPLKVTPLGPVSHPEIPVAITTLIGPRVFRFVIDTGVDFSLAPRRLVQQAGLVWEGPPEVQAISVRVLSSKLL